mmetsp:Transcript_10158/g.61821  ORF Transcript_10158/g.61821 Transcript_10158/m.61821 type:complete len:249 (-) Transcript_10158:27-773(-)
MVFIICASASTARRSFSILPGRNSGSKAISRSASSTCGSSGAPVNVSSGAWTWNTVWWKSVYALLLHPVPSSPSLFLLPRNVTCSTRCATPCSSSFSSTLPVCTSRWASNLLGGTALGSTTYRSPLDSVPTRSSSCSFSFCSSSPCAGAATARGRSTRLFPFFHTLLPRQIVGKRFASLRHVFVLVLRLACTWSPRHAFVRASPLAPLRTTPETSCRLLESARGAGDRGRRTLGGARAAITSATTSSD